MRQEAPIGNAGRKWRWLGLLAVLLAVLSMTGCKRTPESKPSFDRKYQDYKDGDQPVVYVGENEDGTDGMALYAPGVVELTAENGCNQVAEADDAARRYVFENPSQELLALQPGDVFVMPKEGITAKVGTIEKDGDRVTVTGAELALEDLFEYVNLDMALPMTGFTYDPDELGEGMEIILPGEQTDPAPSVRSLSSRDAGMPASSQADWNSTFNTGIVFKKSISVALGSLYPKGDTSWRCDSSHVLAFKTIHVEFKYSSWDHYLYTGVWFDYETGWEGTLKFEGTWNMDTSNLTKSWPRVSVFIPGTPIAVYLTGNLDVSLSGSMEGKISQGENRTAGFTCEITERGSAPIRYDKLNGKHSDASLNLEGKAEATLGIEAGIGIPFVVDAYVEARAGAQAVGKLSVLEAGSETNADEIHDCRKCIDGDVNLVLRLNSGIQATLLRTIANKKLELNWLLSEEVIKIGDFYASYRDGEGVRPELGTGECPHRRYRVDISVLKPKGRRAGYAEVKAVFPDQRTAERVMDAGGEGVIYLPSGDNLLTASLKGLRGQMHVAVNDRPASATIQLKEVKQVYIIYGLEHRNNDNTVYYDDISAYPELESIFRETFPDAVFVNGGDEAGRCLNWADASAVEELCGNELSPGDIVITAEAVMDPPTQYIGIEYIRDVGGYFYWDFMHWTEEDPEIYNVMRLQAGIALEWIPEQMNGQLGPMWVANDVALIRMYSAHGDYNVEANADCIHGEVPHTCYYTVEREWIHENGYVVTAGGYLFDENYRVTGWENEVRHEWDRDTDSDLSHQLFMDAHKDPAVFYAIARQTVLDVSSYVQLLQEGDYFEKVAKVAGVD